MTRVVALVYRRIVPQGQRFVGRETELSILRGAVHEAASGRGGLVLVAGEPGIGKTRLVSEAARFAASEAVVALWGHCPDAEGAPPFRPWRQIVRAARDHSDLAELRDLEDLLAPLPRPSGNEIRSGARGTQRRLAGARVVRDDGPLEQARFELFERTADALRAASRRTPLLVVLDDLHWADRSSVKLVQFLAREIANSPVLLLATFREVEPSSSPDVARLLGEMAVLGRTIPLRGLVESEVGELMADRAGAVPRIELVRTVLDATGGNPFFVDEVVRLLVAEHRLGSGAESSEPLPIPLGVRAAISRRIDALGEAARPVLAAAAVGGREIDLAVVARATDLARPALLGLLEGGERLGLLARGRGDGARFSFAHALVQETLYDDLAEGERSRWHGRLGAAIESLHRQDLEPHVARLAHHFGAAARGGEDATKAVEYGLRAGEAAIRQLAFEKAELELERALGSLDLVEGETVALRCRIELAIADARRGSGEVEAMTDSFRRAIDLARDVSADAFADAVLRLAAVRHESFFVDQLLVGLLEEAIERLPATPSALRARCLGRLGATLHLDPTAADRRIALADEAIAMARSLGDRSTLAWVLMNWIIASLGPDNLEKRLAVAGEVMRIADAAGDDVATLEAQTWRIHDLLELGDIEAVDLAIRTFTRLADRLKQPIFLWHVATWRVMRALLEGRLGDAETLLDEALAAGQRAQQQSALMRYGEGLLMLRYEQGRLRELEGLVRMAADQARDVKTWRIVIAGMHLKNERLCEAQAELDAIAAEDFADLPRDANWLFGVVSLADLTCELGDVRRARLVHDLLLPFAGRMAATRPAVSFAGSISHFLGRLASVLGEDAAAEAHFERALREHRQLGSAPWVARTRTEYARLLLGRDDPAALGRALALATAAVESARELDLGEIRPRAEAVLERAQECVGGRAAPLSATAASPAGGPSTAAHLFLCEGEFWRIVFQGSEVRVRDLTGVRQIAHLLSRPGEDVSVLDLIDVSVRRAPGGNGEDAPSLRDAGEALDRRARIEYRAEIAALEAQLEEARSFNDLGRVHSIEHRIAAISDELSRSLGLGGRPRRVGAPVERARVSVTRTIRDAIHRIEALDARLGRFLDESIRTGRLCSYRPALDRELVWRVSSQAA